MTSEEIGSSYLDERDFQDVVLPAVAKRLWGELRNEGKAAKKMLASSSCSIGGVADSAG